jgi:flagellar hook-associated protein 3 FlgL
MALTFDIVRDGVPAINAAQAALAQAQEQVATGKLMQSIADNPAAASRAVGEHTELSLIDSYQATANAVSSRQSAADSTLTDLVQQLTSAMATLTGAQGSTATQSTLDAAADSLAGVRDAIASDVNTTYQGTYLFSGSQVTQAAYTNVGGVWTYQGDNAPVNVSVNTGTQVADTWDGQAILQGSDSTDVLTSLDTLVTAVRSGDAAGMAAGMTALQSAFNRATQAQDKLGTDENSVTNATSRLTTLSLATDARRSQDEDANMATAAAQMSQAQTALEAALAAIGQTSQLTLFNYIRG